MSATVSSPDAKRIHALAQLEKRDYRALTRPMDVYADDPATRGPHEVAVYHKGRRHIVNYDVRFCDCEDFHYRGEICQHIRRVEFAFGGREVPEGINEDALDDGLRDQIHEET